MSSFWVPPQATKKPFVWIAGDPIDEGVLIPSVLSAAEKFGIQRVASIPLLAADRSVGTLNVLDHRAQRFTEDEVSLLTAFADQASLALEKARLLNEAERERERAETERDRSDTLYRVSNLLGSAHDTDEVLDLIVNEATRLLGAHAGFMRLLDGDAMVSSVATKSGEAFRAEIAERLPTLPLDNDESPVGRVMATKRPIVTEDLAKGEGSGPSLRTLAQKYDYHGAVYVPLVANDRSLGVLILVDTHIRLFTEDEVSLLTAFADQASLALEKARLLNEAEREKERAETERERSDALYRVSNLLASAHDTDEVLDLIVNEAVRLLGTSFCHIRLLEGDELVVRVATGPGGEYIMEHDATVKVGEGTSLTGHVWATKKPLSGKDAAQYSHQARVGIWQNKVESQKRWLRFLSWPMTSP